MSELSTEDIEARQEQRREELSARVAELEYTLSPGRARRRAGYKAKERVGRLRESVFGSPDDGDDGPSAADQAKGAASDAQDRAKGALADAQGRAGDAASSAKDSARRAAGAVSDAPDAAKDRTQGNPLAAGAIAFGVGMLAAGLLPSSRQERQAAVGVREQVEEPVKERAKEVATAVKDDAQEVAQDRAEDVKATARRSARRTQGEAQRRTQRVRDEGQQRARRVRD